MGKYNAYDRQPPVKKATWKIHPVWRGIGCILMILIPILAYAGAVLLVQANFEQRWLPIPRELVQTVRLPVLGSVQHLFANLIVTVLLMIIGFGAVTIFYMLVYRIAGPPRYLPPDVPPVRSSPARSRTTARRR